MHWYGYDRVISVEEQRRNAQRAAWKQAFDDLFPGAAHPKWDGVFRNRDELYNHVRTNFVRENYVKPV